MKLIKEIKMWFNNKKFINKAKNFWNIKNKWVVFLLNKKNKIKDKTITLNLLNLLMILKLKLTLHLQVYKIC
jgi:hypothetical protein